MSDCSRENPMDTMVLSRTDHGMVQNGAVFDSVVHWVAMTWELTQQHKEP